MNNTSIVKYKYDFEDPRQAIAFLKTKFNKKIYIKKRSKLLWQLILINNYHPQIINDIIDNLQKLTSWKSYFLLLLNIYNQKRNANNTYNINSLNIIETRIYNLLATQYLSDVELYKSGNYHEIINNDDVINVSDVINVDEYKPNEQNKKYISTLAKWLPSKRSTINKKINFYKRFVPLVSSKNYSQSMYEISVNIKQLKNVLGITNKVFNEYKFDDSKQSIINFNKLSRLSVSKHIKEIRQKQELSNQYVEYLVEKYSSYNMFKIITLFRYNYTLDEFCKIALDRVWRNNYPKYTNDLIKYYKINLLKYDTLFVDLSKDIINDPNKMRFVITIVLLASSLNINVRVIGNNKEILLNDYANIIKKYHMVITYVASCKQDNAFKEQVGCTCSIILVNKLVCRDFGNAVFPGSVVWELENNKKIKIINYPKFTKIQGFNGPNKFKLINNILKKHEWEAFLKLFYKYIAYLMIIAFLIITVNMCFF